MTGQERAEVLCHLVLKLEVIDKKLDEFFLSTEQQLAAIQRREGRIIRQGEDLMAVLDDVVASVSAESEVIDSAVVLLGDLKTKLDQAIATGDPAKIQAVVDAIGAQKQRLADAVAANTPAAVPVP